MDDYHIAVVDIGKTNKKILIYDRSLQILEQRYQKFEEFQHEGVQHDDVEGLKTWILQTLKSLAGSFNIGVVSVTTHGATFVAVDEQGKIAVPEVSYTTDPGEDFHTAFYEKCGDSIELQQSTATPNFNMLINLAKGIHFVKDRYPAQFGTIRHILTYPQYFGYVLTGNACADPTYTGNHTYLWDFHKMKYSEVADKLNIRHLLPDTFKRPWEVLGKLSPEIAAVTGLDPEVVVTVGIHDSNASMLPYIVCMDEDFLLNSTGTWCVIMHEKEQVQFAPDELGKVVFYNMNAFSRPIKTAIFMGGMEFEYYTNLFKKIAGDQPFPGYDHQLYQKLILDKRLFILPSVVRGIGQFPESRPRVVEDGKVFAIEDIESGKDVPAFFSDFATAYAVLNISLAVQTKVSFDRADMYDGLSVFTEGGFSKNGAYNALMASFYPRSRFYLTDLKEATAYGTAMLGKAAMENIDLYGMRDQIVFEKKPVNDPGLTGLDNYFNSFLQLL